MGFYACFGKNMQAIFKNPLMLQANGSYFITGPANIML